MPRWRTGQLTDAPRFTRRHWFALLGPGLVMGGSAIGGGEWLVGPIVTAKYGGALLWLATLSIFGQMIYNLEISRYTLYCGEPIFSGKFRTPPGPFFWLWIYLILDFGMVFPYLAANAATPLATLIKGGEIPRPDNLPGHLLFSHNGDWYLMKGLAYLIFIGALVPLLFGGKIYNSLRAITSFKIVIVLGFLLILALFFSTRATWWEIGSGLFKFGTVPVERSEDRNNNGQLDPGEDWDGDGRLDALIEPRLRPISEYIASGQWPDLNHDGIADAPIDLDGDGRFDTWGDLNGDGIAVPLVDRNGDGQPDEWPDIIIDPRTGLTDGRPDTFVDLDGDGYRDGDTVDNIFVSLVEGRGLPQVDFTLIAFIAALAAIAGSGGLANTPISNYTRDQGWGMGSQVGAIPSMVGGRDIQLAHVGCVFPVNESTLPRWRRWYRHVLRDQLAVWMPACLLGVALPCMLSVQFLRRGFEADGWTAAAMTADGVHDRVTLSGALLGDIFWFMTLFCGFIVLGTSLVTSADGLIRRWVDVFWTSSGNLRRLDPRRIRNVYFWVLTGYALFGLVMLSQRPSDLIKYATMFFNVALGISCWHTLVINQLLLPRALRPGWCSRVGLFLSGLFFFGLGVLTILSTIGLLA